jgi:glycosyltransferase involved in cell wall biosynthesis
VLKIAYITFEYPPETSGGGIGTYMYQVSKATAAFGHRISVFCSGKEEKMIENEGIFIYYINCQNRLSFKQEVVKTFSLAHSVEKFDVIECAEYGADALLIKEKFPEMPLIVKLHAPTYLIVQYNNYFFNYQILPDFKNTWNTKLLKKIYWLIRRSALKNKIFKYVKENDDEYKITIAADYILSPSKRLASVIKKDWKISKKISIIPNIYIPNEYYLKQPIPNQFKTFIFIGKLMVLKGVLDMCKAIPTVLEKHPDIKFIFVGQALDSPKPGVSMDHFMKDELQKYSDNITFTGKIPLEQIPEMLNQSDSLIIPSLWENFPTVCLEAMSAGKLVIGTRAGGIPEIIDSTCGLISKYRKYKNLASKIIYATENPDKMKILAQNGRQKVLNLYSREITAEKMEKIYKACLK